MKRRLLLVCSDFGIPLRGHKGASVHLRAMARSLALEGIEIGIAFRDRDEETTDLDFPVRLFPLPVAPRPDDPDFDPGAMNRATAERLEQIASEFPYDLLYERYALWSTAGLDVATRRGIPFFLEVNAPLTLEAERWRRLPHPAAAAAAERRLSVCATRLFPVSAPLADHLASLGADPRLIEILPNGTDEVLLDLPVRGERPTETAHGLPGEIFTIGFVGSLKQWHGIPELLSAFDRLGGADRGFRLRIAGDGPLADSVQEASRRVHGIDWLGAIPHQEIPNFLSSLDAGVAPYVEEEPGYFSPMKIIEYQAAGLPVVASGGRGVRDLVRNGETGLLVPAGDVPALAGALENLRADRVLAAQLGRNARRFAAERTWRGNARRVLARWDEAASNSATGVGWGDA